MNPNNVPEDVQRLEVKYGYENINYDDDQGSVGPRGHLFIRCNVHGVRKAVSVQYRNMTFQACRNCIQERCTISPAAYVGVPRNLILLTDATASTPSKPPEAPAETSPNVDDGLHDELYTELGGEGD